MYNRITKMLRKGVQGDRCTFDLMESVGDGRALKKHSRAFVRKLKTLSRAGREHIVLTDEHQGDNKVAIPMILATGAVHSHLVAPRLRSFCSITVRASECIDKHYFAVLIGVGATCVNAYLAQDAIADRHARGLLGDISIGEAVLNFKNRSKQAF